MAPLLCSKFITFTSLFIFLLITECVLISTSSVFQPVRVRIGIDYGPRLIGIAISNPFGVVTPHSTIQNNGDLCKVSFDIISLAKINGASEIVLGIPLDSNGKLSYKVKNFNGKICLDFSKVLSVLVERNSPRVSVHLFDERYSTREAKARLKFEKKHVPLDAMAAACILERYVEDEGEGSICGEACEYPPPRDLAFFDYNKVKEHIREQYSRELTPLQEEQRRMQMLKEGICAPRRRPLFKNKDIKNGELS